MSPPDALASRPLAVVQARMTSSRLPGKVLADVGGQPLLALLLARLGRSGRIERIVVATSTDDSDDPLARLAEALGHQVHRGPLDDVLARFVGAVAGHAGPYVRVTGDCPLIDPAIVDRTIDAFEARRGCMYASNVEPRTFPDGLDTEVMSQAGLAAAAAACDAEAREHVTSELRRRPDAYPRAALVGEADLSALRWTVDTEADLEFVRQAVARLGAARHTAGMGEILAAIRRRPSLTLAHGARRG